MLLTLGLILLVAWALGLFAFHVAGGLIHVLVVLALISFVAHMLRGRRGVA
ncbi:MAG: lmo0937 family membrane protein [Acidobacteriota bacterium]